MTYDLHNQKFGRLTVIKRQGSDKKKNATWLCKCDCGNEHLAASGYLRRGEVKSCGCLDREQCASINYRHGESDSPLYRRWQAMKQRCTSPCSPSAKKHYTEKGIRVCDKWNDYLEFKRDMEESFFEHVSKYGLKNTTLDRIDNSNGYCKENCRWATILEQANNHTNHVFLTYNGKTQNLAEWARETGLDYSCLKWRAEENWTPEKALTTPSAR